ncbi:MAG TPA: type II toxin-antitoxin system RelE/ParE family toxin [Segetibacter sp.]
MKIYTYKLIDEAESDVKEIFEWYENKFKGLGDRFLSHLEKAFDKIASNPHAFAQTGFFDFRRFVLNVFPYKIFYFLNNNTIIITAVIYKSRSKRYWRKKLKKSK